MYKYKLFLNTYPTSWLYLINKRNVRRLNGCALDPPPLIPLHVKSTPSLCVQMDFTWTFQTTTTCNSINQVWSHFYEILVVLKYHRCLWANIFDTDISRCINTYIKVVYLAFFGYLCPYKFLCQRYWLMGVYGTYFKTTKII